MTEAAPQREHSLRELFNALRYVIRYGIAWRAMPNDFPPWAAVYQHSKRRVTQLFILYRGARRAIRAMFGTTLRQRSFLSDKQPARDLRTPPDAIADRCCCEAITPIPSGSTPAMRCDPVSSAKE
jgi:transposase